MKLKNILSLYYIVQSLSFSKCNRSSTLLKCELTFLQHSDSDYIVCITSRYLWCVHFQFHYKIFWQRFFLRNYNTCVYTGSYCNQQYWNYVLGNMNMIVNSWYNNLSDKQANMNKSTLNNSFPVFQYYEQVVRQRMSCAKSRNYLIKTVWWCSIVYQTIYLF